MVKVYAISKAVVADAIRRKVLWIVVVFSAILALAIPTLPSYGVGVADAVFREVSIALMYSAALVMALALSVTRIPLEVERRTVFNVISRDVRRWQYVFATWLGMFAVLGVMLLVFTVVTIGIGALNYQVVMWRLFEASLAVWLEIGVVMAFAVMLSCSFGPVTSAIGALAFVFIGHAFVSLLGLPELTQAPWYIPNLEVFNVINPVAHGSGVRTRVRRGHDDSRSRAGLRCSCSAQPRCSRGGTCERRSPSRPGVMIGIAVALLLVALIGGQALASATAPPGGVAATGRVIGQTSFAYLGGLRTFAAAVLWNRLEPLFDGYYHDRICRRDRDVPADHAARADTRSAVRAGLLQLELHHRAPGQDG